MKTTESEESESATLATTLLGVAPAEHVRLSKGLVAVVDPDMADTVSGHHWQWRRRAGKRLVYFQELRPTGTRDVLMHRLVLGDVGGADIVHVNHNGLDNRRANLLVVSKRETYEHTKTRGGQPGVWLQPETGEWFLEVITGSGVAKYGPFESDDAAREALQGLQAQLPSVRGLRMKDIESDLAEASNAEVREYEESRPAEPRQSVRPVRAPRNNTGIAGVTQDTVTERYVVRVGNDTRRVTSLSDAAVRASIWLTERGQQDKKPYPGEKVVQIARYKVLTDENVGEWLWPSGDWAVRKRENGLLDVRRPRGDGSHPDDNYTNAARLITCAAPGEVVKFVNGDRLDLRRANLQLIRREYVAPKQAADSDERYSDEDE